MTDIAGSPIMSGKLKISVIEARDVVAQTYEIPFYVRLRIGGAEATTSHGLGSKHPIFKGDVQLPSKEPEKDNLKVDLLQKGHKGDLVLGSCRVPVSSLMSTSAQMKWLPLTTVSKNVSANLCVVLQWIPDPIKKGFKKQGLTVQAAVAIRNNQVPRQVDSPQASQKSEKSEASSSTESSHPHISSKAPAGVSRPLGVALGVATGGLAVILGAILKGRGSQGVGSVTSSLPSPRTLTISPGDKIRVR